ncbi:MAG: L-threonine 3-dehydrogenase [Dehalococcoidales bacterium]|nr:L-threonine 3-dehydrogenase [Dehalococcoidales bacterium]
MKGVMRAVIKPTAAPGAALATDWPIPQPGPKDLIIKVKAAAICGTDSHIYDWTPYAQTRVKPPTPIGHEFCGEVVEMGSAVEGFEIGDLVAGETHIPCGNCYLCRTGQPHICQNMLILGIQTPGVFADYTLIPAVCAWKLPKDFDPEIGAILEPMGVGVHGALLGPLHAKNVAVLGCGPIGQLAIATAAACGAKKIMVSDMEDVRLEMAKSMGATHLYNARRDDVVAEVRKETNDLGADVVLEVTGVSPVMESALKMARKAARVTFIGLPNNPVTFNDFANDLIYKELEVSGVTGRKMYETWFQVQGLIESGKVNPKKVITHRFPLEEYDAAFVAARDRVGGKVLFIP